MSRFIRQNNILTPEKAWDSSVTIIGLGTVGSFAASVLARMGVGRFELWDFDVVEDHNLASQDFVLSDLALFKTNAVKRNILSINEDISVSVNSRKFEGGEPINTDYVILCPDSINVRKEVYNYSLKHNNVFKGFVDVRMGGNHMHIWSVANSSDGKQRYESSLWDSDTIEEAPCGGSSFTSVGFLSGGMVGQVVRALIMGDLGLPFYQSFDFDSFDVFKAGKAFDIPVVEEVNLASARRVIDMSEVISLMSVDGPYVPSVDPSDINEDARTGNPF